MLGDESLNLGQPRPTVDCALADVEGPGNGGDALPGCERPEEMSSNSAVWASGAIVLSVSLAVKLVIDRLTFPGCEGVLRTTVRLGVQAPGAQRCWTGTPLVDLLLRCPAVGIPRIEDFWVEWQDRRGGWWRVRPGRVPERIEAKAEHL